MIERETTVYYIVPRPQTPVPPPSRPSSTTTCNRMPNDAVVALLLAASFVAFLFGVAIGSLPPTTKQADSIPNLGPGPILPSGPPPITTR